jgi:uncharacterized protein (DUF362 family)
MTARAIVAVEAVPSDLPGGLRRALEAAEWTRFVPRGADVSLKVNLGWDMFIPGSITSPFFVSTLIDAIREHVGRIYLVECDQVLEDIEKACRMSLMDEVCRRTGAQWVNMGNIGAVPIDAPRNVVLKRIEVPQILRDTVLITVPVMKTHAKTGLTGSLKNQWGCLPKTRHEWHLVLDEAIADLNAVIRPAFAVMDGTIGLEGNGPKSGSPRIAERVLCSSDPVALDTVQALCMGLDPGAIRHLSTCVERGVGTNDLGRIDIRGLDPVAGSVRFRPAKHNAVSLVENLLRQSLLKRLFFNTPVFGLCLAGAKVYYRGWSAMHAERCWRTALAHPYYGPTWRAAYEGRFRPSA